MPSMKKVFKIIFVLCFVASTLIFLPTENAHAQSASLYFSYSSLQVSLNESFSINVMVNTGGSDINTVTAAVSFPQDTLEYVSSDGTNSVLESAVTDTESGGVVTVTRYAQAGTTYNGTGEFVTLNFRAIESGTATLSFTDDSYVSGGDDNLLGTTGTSTIYVGNLPSAGIFDKPKVVLIVVGALILVGLGSLGILQYLKEKQDKQLTLN